MITYADGAEARVGDLVQHDVWLAVVDSVIDTPEQQADWGLTERGLIFRTHEAGLDFEPVDSIAWDANILLRRDGQLPPI